METNPFEVGQGGGASPTELLTVLRQTRPWVLFMGALAGLLALLMLCGSFGVFAMGSAFSEIPGLGGFGFLLGFIYVAFGLLYVPLALFLFQYGNHIGVFLRTESPESLTEALRQHKNFWRYSGIMTLVIIALYIIVLIAVFALGASAFSAFAEALDNV